MSAEVVKAFIGKVTEDEDLQTKLQSIDDDGEDALGQIIGIASEAGFSFEAEDYQTVVHEMAKVRHAAGELSDEDLEAVAGGRDTLISKGSCLMKCSVENESQDLDKELAHKTGCDGIIVLQ